MGGQGTRISDRLPEGDARKRTLGEGQGEGVEWGRMGSDSPLWPQEPRGARRRLGIPALPSEAPFPVRSFLIHFNWRMIYSVL